MTKQNPQQHTNQGQPVHPTFLTYLIHLNYFAFLPRERFCFKPELPRQLLKSTNKNTKWEGIYLALGRGKAWGQPPTTSRARSDGEEGNGASRAAGSAPLSGTEERNEE